MREPVTGAILVGGASRRFGAPKAFARFRGQRLIDRVAGALAEICDEILVVGGEPADFADLDLPHLPDRFPGEGPLGGLATALSGARSDRVLLVSCDLPLLSAQTLRAVVARSAKADITLPENVSGPEPLCAVYHRRCLEAIERAIERGDRNMTSFHEGLVRVSIPVALLPESESLYNVNRLEDLSRLEEADAARVLRIAARVAALPTDEMRGTVLRETLEALGPDAAVEVVHALLTADAPRERRTAVAATACVTALSGGAGIPYSLVAELYQAASARGYEEVRRLLLRPGPQRQASNAELQVDPRVSGRTLGERKWLARRNDPDLIDRLLYDPDPAVLEQLLANPRLTEREVIRIAAHRPGIPEVLRMVAHNSRFGKRARVRRALVSNPYTPTELAANLLPFLPRQEVEAVARDPALHPTVREAAQAVLARRAGEGTGS